VGPLTAKVVRVVCAAFVVATVASGQTSGRRLTTIDAIRRFSGYFHLQTVVLGASSSKLRQDARRTGRRVQAAAPWTSRAPASDSHCAAARARWQVMLDSVNPIEGPVEIRATVLDIGRLTPSDPRLNRYENKTGPRPLAAARRGARTQRHRRGEG
jgi:hypothetical protein